MNDKPLLSARSLTKTYVGVAGRTPVLRGIDLDIGPGEMVAIVGPSGCGKSSLLFILGLLAKPSGGSYVVGDRNVLNMTRREESEFRRTQVGFVFQSCNLIENATVYENLEFPLIYAGVARRLRRERIADALDRVDLSHRIHYRTNELSGGEQQRVALSRAMVNRPKIILADEPTGQLDRENGMRVMADFERFVGTGETGMVVVTHDMEVARRCTRMYRLEDGVLQQERGGG